MNTFTTLHIGLDIGGTKCAVSLAKRHGRDLHMIAKRRFDTSGTVTPVATLDRLCDLALKLAVQTNNDVKDIQSVGISCGGPLDSKRGIILSPPNLPRWDDVAIVKHVENHLKTSTFLENDANACALAEWQWGAGEQCDNMIFLTFGTGMGAGLILNGKLYRGTNDLAGEVGHIRLSDTGPVGYSKAGSFEGFCSGGGLADAARQSGLSLNAQEVFDHAASGHAQCNKLVQQLAYQLGRSLAILIDILNPQKIILGSIYTRQQAVLKPLIMAELQREALPLSRTVCEILPAKLGESIGDYAALAVACNGAGS